MDYLISSFCDLPPWAAGIWGFRRSCMSHKRDTALEEGGACNNVDKAIFLHWTDAGCVGCCKFVETYMPALVYIYDD
ncbi:hypothetical protein VNO77_06541 [Canavalia gladiata]|uniref:Uncharacterized protein n=1 Tax=Canavalia gladiata TaxID=3824 RepID=A0AAN9M6Q6_CANGL